MKGDEIGLIVIGFFIIIILVVGGLYLYHTSRFNEFSEGNKMMEVNVSNQTPFGQTITTKDGAYFLGPNGTGKITLERHDDISAVRSDGEPVESIHRLSNDNVNHLYITLDGFRTNLSSSYSELLNASPTDVLFIQKSLKGGEKFIVHRLPPESVVGDVYIPGGSLWMVAYPDEPDIPITELKVGNRRVSQIVFDGITLKAY